MSKREQLSIPVDPELRNAVARAAAREQRTIANWVRRIIADAARNTEEGARAA